MAGNSSKLECRQNLIGVLNHSLLMIIMVASLSVLQLQFTIISSVFFWIMVSIAGILTLVLWLMYCFDSKCTDFFINVIIFCIHVLCSCVFGLMSFADNSAIQNGVALTWILLINICFKVIFSFVQRYNGLINYSSSTLTWTEVFELVGFFVTGLMVLSEEQAVFSKYALFLILVSFAFTVVGLRLVGCFNNPHVIVSLVSFMVCQVVFFSTVDLPIYGVALGCFTGRLLIEPVLDLIFSDVSLGEKLNSVFSSHGCFQKMFILIVFVFAVIFCFHAGVSTIDHNGWHWIIYVVLLPFWICFHSYFIPLCWDFSNQMSQCSKVYRALEMSKTSMEKMMATKGMRLQAQLAQSLIVFTFGSTLIFGIVTLVIPSGTPPWHKDEEAALAASWLIVLLVEGTFYAVTDKLQESLPGSCTACVIMPPSSFDGQSELLQSGELLSIIMQFFKQNSISCRMDSMVQGQSVKTLGEQLKLFFQETNPDTNGKRYDSYVVYFCGDVEKDGKWKLTEGKFQFEQMQLLWDSCNTDEDFQSRLILIQDAKYSEDWLKKIAKNKNNVIAMQTCQLSKLRDPETGRVARVGDFTQDWIEYNSSTENSINWQGRGVKAVYRVSPSWSDYKLSMPDDKDIEEYLTKFPEILNTLTKFIILGVINIKNVFKDEPICCSCWRRFMMNWFPPSVVDTGHGFKLVKS